MPRSWVWPGAWPGEDRGWAHAKPETTCYFCKQKPKYPVGEVLTLPREGSALGKLGVGVQVLGNSQARDWGDTSNSILQAVLCIFLQNCFQILLTARIYDHSFNYQSRKCILVPFCFLGASLWNTEAITTRMNSPNIANAIFCVLHSWTH